MIRSALAPALLAASAAGCVRAPDLVIVDRKTALEQQAGGSFPGLEEDLEQAGISARPEPYTAAQLPAAGGVREGATEGIEGGEPSPAATRGAVAAARVDELLTRRCLGEARDGTLVETRDTCAGSLDPVEAGRLVERANRARWQVWRYLQRRRPASTLEEVRRAWREVHRQEVVCGGQVQRDDGAWEVKRC